MIFGALAGGLLTVLAGAEPGWLLGLFVVSATTAGASAVRRTAAYLVIPVPALAYFVAAVIAGLIHDRGVDTSRAILFVNAVQWIADGFFWMFLATVIAVAITIGRWLMTGQAGYRPGGFWLARMSGAWAAPDATGPRPNARAPRAPPARPGPSRSSTAPPSTAPPSTAPSGNASPSSATRSGNALPEDASTQPLGANPSAIDTPGADAARMHPLPREKTDHERSAEG